jgi:hypothetical protein
MTGAYSGLKWRTNGATNEGMEYKWSALNGTSIISGNGIFV